MLKSITVAGLVLLTGAVSANAEDWPMIRGPQIDGHAGGHGLLSRSRTARLKTVWKQKLGSGYSSVVTSGRRLVTAYCDDQSDYVTCLSADTGQELWRYRLGSRYQGVNGSFDGPVATPAIAANNVYMISPVGELVALNLQTGELLWKINVAEKFGVQPAFYGFGASPYATDRIVLIQLGPPVGTLCAFQPSSGELLWTYGEDVVGYQTPVPYRFQGRDIVLAAGNQRLFGVDVESGSAVFDVGHEGKGGTGAWSLIPVPLGDDHIFLAHDDLRSRVVSLDATADQSVSVDGVWNERSIRNSYNIPVALNGHLFAFSSRILTCVDGNSGKILWRSRKPGDGFLSVLDNHLVIQTKNGSLHLARAGESGYNELASTEVFDDVTWCLPAIDGDSIYVRSVSEIARVDLTPGTPAEPRLADDDVKGPRFAEFLRRVEAAPAEQKSAVVDQWLKGLQATPYCENDIVHFLLRGDYSDVAVASDLFGCRQERSMKRIDGTDLFYYTASIPAETRASYVFVADYRTITDPGNPRITKSSFLVEDMEMVFLYGGETLTMSWFDMPGREPVPEPAADSDLRGELSLLNIASTAMNRRVPVTVYTPPGYRPEGRPHPVVFIHDGVAARTEGRLPRMVEAAQSPSEDNMPVLVFIDVTFSPMMGAAGYEKMFGEELLPTVRTRFNISRNRDQCGSLGGGFGGMLALTSALSNRSDVGRIGLHSIHTFEFLDGMIAAAIDQPGPKTEILMQWGAFELMNPDENWDMAVNAERLGRRLQQAGHPIRTQEVPDGTDWVCWRTHTEEMLRFFIAGLSAESR